MISNLHKQLNIAFRVDINRQLGTGHYVRMSALADAFAELGHACSFFTGEDEPVDFGGYDIVVLDTYLVDDEYIARLHVPGRLLVCYDDNALYTYDCDVLLNANLHAGELAFRTAGASPVMLLGGKYALLRREFRESGPVPVKANACNVFVCFGGSDARNMTPRAVEALQGVEGVRLSVVLGGYTKCDDEVMEIAGDNVTVHKTPQYVSEIMRKCGIAVTSSGSITYEMAALGLPAVTITQADNQFLLADYMTRNGLMKNVGSWENVDFEVLKAEAEALLRDFSRRKAEASALTAAVDKNGAMNAAVEIISYARVHKM